MTPVGGPDGAGDGLGDGEGAGEVGEGELTVTVVPEKSFHDVNPLGA
jgi:hypothetical protein